MPIIQTICPVCGKGGEKDLPFMSGLEDSPIYQSCANHTKSQVRAAYRKLGRTKAQIRAAYLKMGRKDHDTIHEAQPTTYAD